MKLFYQLLLAICTLSFAFAAKAQYDINPAELGFKDMYGWCGGSGNNGLESTFRLRKRSQAFERLKGDPIQSWYFHPYTGQPVSLQVNDVGPWIEISIPRDSLKAAVASANLGMRGQPIGVLRHGNWGPDSVEFGLFYGKSAQAKLVAAIPNLSGPRQQFADKGKAVQIDFTFEGCAPQSFTVEVVDWSGNRRQVPHPLLNSTIIGAGHWLVNLPLADLLAPTNGERPKQAFVRADGTLIEVFALYSALEIGSPMPSEIALDRSACTFPINVVFLNEPPEHVFLMNPPSGHRFDEEVPFQARTTRREAGAASGSVRINIPLALVLDYLGPSVSPIRIGLKSRNQYEHGGDHPSIVLPIVRIPAGPSARDIIPVNGCPATGQYAAVPPRVSLPSVSGNGRLAERASQTARTGNAPVLRPSPNSTAASHASLNAPMVAPSPITTAPPRVAPLRSSAGGLVQLGGYRHVTGISNQQCQATCAGDAQCKAWTWSKPGVDGPSAKCWLKHEASMAISGARSLPQDCCVSGRKVER